MPTDETRARIDEWVAVAPDSRVVETARRGDCWTTQALEDGEVRYQETEFGRDEPELNLIASWCTRQLKKIEPRPPAKTGSASFPDLVRKLGN